MTYTIGFALGLLLVIDVVAVVILWRRVKEHDRQLEELYTIRGENDETLP